jgi:cobalt-precorrin-5B (C1)-methyltransferase
VVTKKGLPVPVGEPAINPAPRKLIAETIEEVLAEHRCACRGVAIEIAVPRGEELAKKTFNPRLGIVGGISILGTTGIVVPYSNAAWLASVTQEIDVAVAQGIKELVLTVGARGERLARQRFPLPEEAFVQIGPFFADALRHCARAGVARVTLAAMIGKLAKFAAGNESVHSTTSSQDFAFLAEVARSAGAEAALVEQITRANTAQEVSELVSGQGLTEFHLALCRRAGEFAAGLLPGSLTLDVYLTDQDGAILGRYPPGH